MQKSILLHCYIAPHLYMSWCLLTSLENESHFLPGVHLSKLYDCSRNSRLRSLARLTPLHKPSPTCLKSLKGTNWTMSRRTGSPLGERRIPSSPSSICMSVKSALPTPTMMTDMGRWEACTMASLVSAMSVMTPSVRISRMKYSWWERRDGRKVGMGVW